MDNDETEARYENEYERYLDPFRKFSLQEKQRKYGQLRTYDKAALGLVRFPFFKLKFAFLLFASKVPNT